MEAGDGGKLPAFRILAFQREKMETDFGGCYGKRKSFLRGISGGDRDLGGGNKLLPKARFR